MNAIQENKVSMFYKVRIFFSENLAILGASVAQLITHVANFNNKVDEIQQYDTEATENLVGHTVQKQDYKVTMRDLTLVVSNGVKAYSLSLGDKVTAFKYAINKSDIDNARDTNALYACERIYNHAQTIAAALIPFGVSATKITDLQAAVNNFKSILQDPKDERAQSTAAGSKVDIAIKEADDILILIDSLMATQAIDYNFEYLHYLNARKIDEDLGGGSPQLPDFTLTLTPMIFTTGFDLPYNALQRIRVKNLSNDIVEWSLSNVPTAFIPENTIIVAPANDTTTYLSSSIGAAGNFLVLINRGSLPANVEITLLDD